MWPHRLQKYTFIIDGLVPVASDAGKQSEARVGVTHASANHGGKSSLNTSPIFEVGPLPTWLPFSLRAGHRVLPVEG